VEKVAGVLELNVGVNWFCRFEQESLNNKQLEALIVIAENYYKSGSLEESVKYYKQAIKILECAPLYNNLGLVYSHKEDLGKAAHAFQRALQLDGSCAQALYNLSMVLYSAANFDRTVEFLAHIIKWPDVPHLMLLNAYNDTGCAYMRTGEYEKAHESFEKALGLDPKFEKPLVNLGNMYCEQGKFEEATSKFKMALELNQNNAAAYNGLGIILLNQQKFDLAKEYFDKALEIKSFSNAARINQNLIKKIISEKSN